MKWQGLLTSQHSYIPLHGRIRHTSLKDKLAGEFELLIPNCPVHMLQVLSLPFHKTVWPTEWSCGWQTPLWWGWWWQLVEDSNRMVGECIVYIDSIMSTKASKTTHELLFVWLVSSVLCAFCLISINIRTLVIILFYFGSNAECI